MSKYFQSNPLVSCCVNIVIIKSCFCKLPLSRLLIYPLQYLIFSMEAKRVVSLTIKLSSAMLEAIDKIRVEWGIDTRADIVELLLAELLIPESNESLTPRSGDSKDV